MKTFFDYLKDIHAKDYTGTDDEMYDSFELWLSGLQSDDMIEYGDQYREYCFIRKVRMIISEVKQFKFISELKENEPIIYNEFIQRITNA